MSWLFLDTGKTVLRHTSEIQAFLMDREAYCVTACYRFLQFDDKKDRIWIQHDKEEKKLNAILFLSGRVLYPVFTIQSTAAADIAILLRNYRDKFGTRRSVAPFFSIQGKSDDVQRVQEALDKISYGVPENIDYDLMALENQSLPASPRIKLDSIQVHEQKHRDKKLLEALYPLQADYEKEEVIPKGGVFSKAGCRMGLERMLKHQLLVAAEYQKTIIGKANSNAFGYTRAQIGGVYVLPQYRGKGVAACLVQHLCKELEARQYIPGLFVRKNNIPALRAYTRVGFERIADYRIAYYTE